MLSVENLVFSYPSESAFTLDVPSWKSVEGARIAVVGRSGSGKTTFLKCLAGLLQPKTGEIVWKDERVPGAKERLVPGNDKIKLVQQDFGQDPHVKVVENLRKYILSHDDSSRAKRIDRWMRQLEIGELEDRKTLQLSGGQMQRVALAQALLAEPEVLLMDEPFSNLDPIHKNEFIPALRALFEKDQVTTISVLHDPVDALRIADHIVVFRDGKIIEEGDTRAIFFEPQNLETLKLFVIVNILEPEEYQSIFQKDFDKPLIEGMAWFRPAERKVEELQVSFETKNLLPTPDCNWREIVIDDKLYILSE